MVLAGGAGAVLIRLFLGRVRNARYSYSFQYALLGISTFSRGLCWQLAAFSPLIEVTDQPFVHSKGQKGHPSALGHRFIYFGHSISIWGKQFFCGVSFMVHLGLLNKGFACRPSMLLAIPAHTPSCRSGGGDLGELDQSESRMPKFRSPL